MSQEDLAEELDLSRFTIQKFENGKNATLDTVLKIANHFDLLDNLYKALKDLEETNNMDSLY
jgi:DNA-binding XRE family transcriptional regulator